MMTKQQVLNYIKRNPETVITWFKPGQTFLSLDTETWYIDIKLEDILNAAYPLKGFRKFNKK